MGRLAQNGPGTSAAHLLGLLAVVVGLLAMHGLSSTHHVSAAVPVPAAVAAVADAHGYAAPDHLRVNRSAAGPVTDLHTTTGEDTAAAVAVSALPDPACNGDCRADVAVLCLAVLVAAGAAALLAAAARRRAGPCLHARPTNGGPPTARRPPFAAPDSVKDLCVSRT